MKGFPPSLLPALAVALLGAGCASPTSRKTTVYWSTIRPDTVAASAKVLASGPYHLYHRPSIGVLNFDEHYDGDDTPWIDRNDEFRSQIADCMDGYDPADITLADVALARWSFLCERLGDDFVWKDYGRDKREVALVAGTRWETIHKYADIRDAMYPDVFQRANDTSKARKVIVRVVDDCYRTLPGKAPFVRDVTVYLHGLEGDNPIPKTSFTLVDDEVVRQIAVEGTERAVPGGSAIDVQTARGRFTVYRPDELLANRAWVVRYLQKQDVWYVGKALVALLNSLSDEDLQSIPYSEG